MSPTLFWYVFKDLIRIFLLASGALAGIMSFGGLFRPIYEHGLNAAQVVQMLGYMMPAMTTYSLPIAALFATTIVYGRLSADNEVTAARAAGISHLSMALPAFVLGLLIALLSLLFLCFVVPVFWLKIERVLYSNLAELVANQIERTHQIRFEHSSTPLTVYAREAYVLPVDPDRPRDQSVRLIQPMIVMFDSSDRTRLPVPDEFYTARSATAVIRQSEDDSSVLLYASLDRGMRFPRRPERSPRQSVQVSVGSTNFGPIALPSPVRENTKFMDVFRLRTLLEHPELGRRVRATLNDFVVQEQQDMYLGLLKRELSGPGGTQAFGVGDERYILERGDATVDLRRGRLVLTAAENGAPIRFVEQRQNRDTVLEVTAREARIRCYPVPQEDRLEVDVELLDCIVSAGGDPSPRASLPRVFSVGMPASLARLQDRSPQDYLREPSSHRHQRLYREVLKLSNGIKSELHARASFGVSCFILVLVGCALGMMFRSGNFLSAFALSVIPALLSIALIVTGQHTCENVPWTITPGSWSNPLPFGLMLIWSGNVAVLTIAIVLLWRLQRQ
jgi:lipopolysaccharide export LptBFGC system permease protein LptF